MIEFSFIRLDPENDAGELEVTVTSEGFSGCMSRFIGRAALFEFAEKIRATDHFWRTAEVDFSTLYPDVPRDEQPAANCTVKLSKFGLLGHVLVEAFIEDEIFLTPTSKRIGSTHIAFLSTSDGLVKFTEGIKNAATCERFTVAIR